MFGTVLTTAVSLMHAYVFWRATTVPFLRHVASRKVLIGVGVGLWLLFYLGRTLRHESGVPGVALEIFTMNWTASLFLLTVCMLIADLVTGFGFLFPKFAPSLRGVALAAGVMMSLTAVIQAIRPPVIRHHEVRLEQLPAELDGTVLVAFSDMHLGSLIGRRWLEARVEQVNALRPDMVVMMGDIFEGHGVPQSEMVPAFQRLSAPLGVYAVLGNHEFYGGHDESVAAIQDAGVHLLRNTWNEVRPGFVLAGVDYMRSRRRGGRDGDPVADALEGHPPGATVYLSHAPTRIEQAAEYGVDLMLSGHTHGGQVWPFGYLVQQEYRFLGGQHEVDGMTVIVCRGTGTWGPRMRLWRPGEMLRITLRSG